MGSSLLVFFPPRCSLLICLNPKCHCMGPWNKTNLKNYSFYNNSITKVCCLLIQLWSENLHTVIFVHQLDSIQKKPCRFDRSKQKVIELFSFLQIIKLFHQYHFIGFCVFFCVHPQEINTRRFRLCIPLHRIGSWRQFFIQYFFY